MAAGSVRGRCLEFVPRLTMGAAGVYKRFSDFEYKPGMLPTRLVLQPSPAAHEPQLTAMRETKIDSAKKTPKVLHGRPPVDTHRKHAVEAYGAAIKLMQEGKFEKALAAFDKLLGAAPVDLAERSRIHRAACERQMQQREHKFTSLEEQYDYSISLLNQGLYEDAREQLQVILKKNPESDYAHYGMAVLHSMTGQVEMSLDHLQEAIRLNPQNRIHARGDSDFQEILDDPRFTELLYPEVN